MENQVVKQTSMSQILASNGIKELCTSLSLTDDQINRAKSSALELSSNPVLANCDKFSLVKFCFETARYNFTRNDCIYPVPYGGKVQAQMGYKGYRELCLRAGYEDVNCSVVYDCDEVYRDRETGKIKVRFAEDIKSLENAHVVGYDAYAVKDGVVTNTLFWTIDKVKKHGQHYSKTYNKIWGDEFTFDKMAKKTLIKQLCGELKTTPELSSAVKLDQLVFGKEGQSDEYLDNPNNFKETKSVANADYDFPFDEDDENDGQAEETN